MPTFPMARSTVRQSPRWRSILLTLLHKSELPKATSIDAGLGRLAPPPNCKELLKDAYVLRSVEQLRKAVTIA